MKIQNLSVLHVAPRFAFLKVMTDEGIVGVGEAMLEGRARTVEMAIRDLEPLLIGEDPRNIEHLWQRMYRGGFYRGGPILMSAISAVDQALWDILGKSLGVPVYQLLGGAVRNKLRVYCHIGGDSLEDLRQSAKEAVKQGFTMVKTTVDAKAQVVESAAYVERQIERLDVLRSELGSGVDIGIDFHGRISPALAVQLAKGFEPYRPMFLEEPCLPENVDTMVTIARSTTIPIATGERLFTRWGFREVLEKQAAAIVQPDLAHCGGISEARKIATMAETYYAGLAPHNPLGPVNLAASLHLAAASPNFLAQEQITFGEGLVKQPFVMKDGYVDLPNGPGLGIELDEAAIAERRYAGDWKLPVWMHDDGSVADW